jgi:hypothetical protein
LPTDAQVIAPYQSDTTLLWQTRHRGWPIGLDIDRQLSLGATHYLSLDHDDESNYLRQHYQVLLDTPEYILIDLTQPIAP